MRDCDLDEFLQPEPREVGSEMYSMRIKDNLNLTCSIIMLIWKTTNELSGVFYSLLCLASQILRVHYLNIPALNKSGGSISMQCQLSVSVFS